MVAYITTSTEVIQTKTNLAYLRRGGTLTLKRMRMSIYVSAKKGNLEFEYVANNSKNMNTSPIERYNFPDHLFLTGKSNVHIVHC